jgi:hypothetical protein
VFCTAKIWLLIENRKHEAEKLALYHTISHHSKATNKKSPALAKPKRDLQTRQTMSATS